jgi:uncharacterized protein YbjT (DUF2867 family)
MKKTILVVGATGMLGQPVARRLQQDGYAVRLLARRPEKARALLGDSFDIVPGDVAQPHTLEPALAGCYGVHVNLNGGPRPEDYHCTEFQGTANVAATAARLGVVRLTYLSGASVCPERSWFYYARAKLNAEKAIQEAGIAYTIFRASWFMESLPLFLKGNRALLVGRQRAPLHWVAARDYAGMVSLAYRVPEANHKTLYVYGPEAIPMPEALRLYCAVSRPGVRVFPTPTWLLALLGKVSRQAQLQDAARLMAYYQDVTEESDPTEANHLLGAPTTTLRQWCREQVRQPS